MGLDIEPDPASGPEPEDEFLPFRASIASRRWANLLIESRGLIALPREPMPLMLRYIGGRVAFMGCEETKIYTFQNYGIIGYYIFWHFIFYIFF